jgi:hypothetical protein
MEATGEGDDRRTAGGVAGDLDGVLHRLGAGGDENRLLVEPAGQHAVQPLRQPHIALIGNHLVAGVGKAVELRLDGLDHLRVAVASVDDGDARREVDVAATLDIPDLRVFGAVGVDLRGHADAARDRLVLAFGNGGILHFCPSSGRRPFSFDGWRYVFWPYFTFSSSRHARKAIGPVIRRRLNQSGDRRMGQVPFFPGSIILPIASDASADRAPQATEGKP